MNEVQSLETQKSSSKSRRFPEEFKQGAVRLDSHPMTGVVLLLACTGVAAS